MAGGRRWVVNASPLILLGKVGQLSLLEDLPSELVVPAGVAGEVQAGPADDPARLWLAGDGARRVQPVGAVPPVIAGWDLGPGESEVLAWAYRHRGWESLVDDRAARTCAAALGLRVVGTLGVVVLAKTAGLVEAAGPIFADLQDAGMRLEAVLLERALVLAGER